MEATRAYLLQALEVAAPEPTTLLSSQPILQLQPADDSSCRSHSATTTGGRSSSGSGGSSSGGDLSSGGWPAVTSRHPAPGLCSGEGGSDAAKGGVAKIGVDADSQDVLVYCSHVPHAPAVRPPVKGTPKPAPIEICCSLTSVLHAP